MTDLLLAKAQKSRYTIVSPKTATEAERYASVELQKYLYQSTGACLGVFSDLPRNPVTTPEIVLGLSCRDAATVFADLDPALLGEEGFAIRVAGENLYIAANSDRGLLYGVYDFLSRFVGFRCFTKDCEKVDTVEELRVPCTLSYWEKPAFEYRDAYFHRAFDGDFAVKNRLNGSLCDLSARRGGKEKFYNFHHSFDDLVPVSQWYESHPEYFSEVDGVRVRERPQLCLSNPEVLRLCIQGVRRWKAEKPECKIFSVSQNDWDNHCRCAQCQKIDAEEGSPAGSILRFVNAIAADLEQDYPDVKIHTFAYMYSRRAPKRTRPHKNVIVRLCNFEGRWDAPMRSLPDGRCTEFLADLATWSDNCQRLYIWDYCVNFANYLMPFPNFYTMAENLRTFRDYGVRGMLQQGNFSFGGGLPTDDLKCYLAAKLMWNPDADADAIIDEFLQGVYQGAAEPMKRYLTLLCEATKGYPLGIYQYPDTAFLTEEVITQAEALLTEAQEKAPTEAIRLLVQKEALGMEYVRIGRIPVDAPEKRPAVDALEQKLHAFGITEVMERAHLDESMELLKTHPYAHDQSTMRRMYYIMQ